MTLRPLREALFTQPLKALAKMRGAPDIPRPQSRKSQSSSVVEQRFRKPQVKGSIPFSGSTFAGGGEEKFGDGAFVERWMLDVGCWMLDV